MSSENPSSSIIDSRRFAAVAALALLFKIALGVLIPLSADESYYWVWSHHPDFGYFDHPPMVAWLFWLGRVFEPYGNAVRLPAILLGQGVIVIWGLLLRDRLTEPRRLAWLALFLACPLTGLGGIVVTPDLPLLFFWSLALFFADRLLRRPEARDFIGLGVSLGLGFCSKYHIVLLPLSLLAFSFDANLRRAFLKPGLFLTFLTGLLCSAPVLGWNAQNDWVSFLFQLRHGLGDNRFSWTWPAEYVLAEGLLLFPLTIWAAIRHRRGDPARRLWWATAFVPLVFFFLTSLRAPVEINWPAVAFPAAFALAAATLSRRAVMAQASFWALVPAALVISVFLTSGGVVHEKLSEPFRYKVLADLPARKAPLYASTYQMASSLWYASKTPVYKLRGMSRVDMYDRWPGSVPAPGTFYLLREIDQALPAAYQTAVVANLGSPAPGLELLEMRAP